MRGKELDKCSCGRVLYECLTDEGARIGVTHTPEDEDYHMQFWSEAEIYKRMTQN